MCLDCCDNQLNHNQLTKSEKSTELGETASRAVIVENAFVRLLRPALRLDAAEDDGREELDIEFTNHN